MDLKLKVKEALATYPGLDLFLQRYGFQPASLGPLATHLSLAQALQMRKIDSNAFIAAWEDFCQGESGQKRTTDGPLVRLDGILPCPIKLPLSDFLEAEAARQGLSLDDNFVSANLGLDGMVQRLKTATPETLPDILASAGFEYFFSQTWRENYEATGLYAAPGLSLQEDLKARGADLKDPKEHFHVLAVVPAVWICRKADFPNGYPKRWSDLWADDFDKDVSIPRGDLDLFNALMLTIYTLYGEEAIEKLAKKAAVKLHPSQMMKDRANMHLPSVSICPYFFASMLMDDRLEAVWPEDGAICSPIFLTWRQGRPEVEAFAKALAGPECGRIMAHNGSFPSTAPGVDNQFTPERKLLFVGFEALRGLDVEAILVRATELFDGV